jgi:hypothetical protein
MIRNKGVIPMSRADGRSTMTDLDQRRLPGSVGFEDSEIDRVPDVTEAGERVFIR